MVDLVPSRSSPIVQALLQQGLAPSQPVATPVEALANALSRGFALQQVRRENARQAEGEEFFQEGLDALLETRTTTDLGALPALGDLQGGLEQAARASPLLPDDASQNRESAPDLRGAIQAFLKAGARGSSAGTALGQALLSQLLPQQREGFTLSPGQTRFGPQGQPVASVPAEPDEETPPSQARLFEFFNELPAEQQPQFLEFTRALRGKGFSIALPDGTVISEGGDVGEILNQAQRGKQITEFQDQVTATLNGLDITENLVGIVRDNPSAIGIPGTLSRIANEAVQATKGTFTATSEEDQAKLDDLLARGDEFLNDMGG